MANEKSGSKSQLSASNQRSSQTGLPVPEGFERAQTSAGNLLTFQGPAEKYAYIQTHGSQFNNAGEYNDQNTKPAA